MTLRRIHITGGPGSGKTTLAQRAAARLQIPCYDLDEVGYEGGAGPERPLAARLADVRQIAAQPGWVTEGIYLGWTTGLFEAAGQVVWLDLPWRLVGWRILARHIKAELRGDNRHSGWLKLYRFMRWVRSYYLGAIALQDGAQEGNTAVNRAATEQALLAYRDKLVRCASLVEVEAYFNSLLSEPDRV